MKATLLSNIREKLNERSMTMVFGGNLQTMQFNATISIENDTESDHFFCENNLIDFSDSQSRALSDM